MSIWGKLAGAAGGFALGGPLGAVVGAIAGHVVDKVSEAGAEAAQELAGNRGRMWREGFDSADPKRVAWATAAVVLASKMAVADGKVTPDEVDAFRSLFNVPPRDMPMVRELFEQARNEDMGVEPYTGQILDMFADEPEVREELLDALYRIAMADGVLDDGEIFFFRKVAIGLGFDERQFDRIHSLNTTDEDRLSPYLVLGVPSTATNDEVKSAYRRLVKDHHPDRLIANGMPEEFVRQATDKLSRINAAWETVCAERGIK